MAELFRKDDINREGYTQLNNTLAESLGSGIEDGKLKKLIPSTVEYSIQHDKKGVSGTNKGISGTNKGVAGTNKGVCGTNTGVSGTNKGISGTNKGISKRCWRRLIMF